MTVEDYIDKNIEEKINEWLKTTKNRNKIYALKKIKSNLLDTKDKIEPIISNFNNNQSLINLIKNPKLNNSDKFHIAYFRYKNANIKKKIKKIDNKIYKLSH